MSQEFTTYKLLVLFLLQNAGKRLKSPQICEMILEEEHVNYFYLQQAISELADAGLISRQVSANTTFCEITDEGRQTLSYFESEIPQKRQEELLCALRDAGETIAPRYLTPVDFYPAGGGAYVVRCQIVEKNQSLVDLSIQVPSEEAARSVALSWPLKSQAIYEKIMEELL